MCPVLEFLRGSSAGWCSLLALQLPKLWTFHSLLATQTQTNFSIYVILGPLVGWGRGIFQLLTVGFQLPMWPASH